MKKTTWKSARRKTTKVKLSRNSKNLSSTQPADTLQITTSAQTPPKVPLYANKSIYNIHHQAALTTDIVRQVGTLTESLVGKMDTMMEAILDLTNIVTI